MAGRLIINADDFGLTTGVSRGILQAHHEGVVTSTTFMVNFPWAPQMAPLLQEAPNLGVGLHLNLTTGEPLLPSSQVPSLVGPDGRLRKSWQHLILRVKPAEVEREWAAQAERFMQLVGRRPSHLDTHRYLQAYPPFARAMVNVAKAYGIPAVRCLYPTQEMLPAELGWKGGMLRPILRRSARLVQASGLHHPGETMAGDFDLPGLLAKVDRVGEGVTEIVCHPGRVDADLRPLSSLLGQRETELQALTAQAVRERLEERHIQLVNFATLSS